MLACAPLCHQQNFDSKLFEKPIKNNYYDMKSTKVAYTSDNDKYTFFCPSVRYGPKMNIAIWVHPLKSLPTNDLECRQPLNPEVLRALTLARISIFCLPDSPDITSFSTYLQVPSSLVYNTSTGKYLMYKRQAD